MVEISTPQAVFVSSQIIIVDKLNRSSCSVVTARLQRLRAGVITGSTVGQGSASWLVVDAVAGRTRGSAGRRSRGGMGSPSGMFIGGFINLSLFSMSISPTGLGQPERSPFRQGALKQVLPERATISCCCSLRTSV